MFLKGTSKTEQNELSQCIFDMCKEHTVQEVKKASFLFIMAYNAFDISAEHNLVFSLQLNGCIHKCFFIQISKVQMNCHNVF